jgi:hypothetical protein
LIDAAGVWSVIVRVKVFHCDARCDGHGDGLSQTPRLFQRERSQHCPHNFAEGDWRVVAGLNRGNESLPLAAVSFVLTEERAQHALLSASNEFQPPKIF